MQKLEKYKKLFQKRLNFKKAGFRKIAYAISSILAFLLFLLVINFYYLNKIFPGIEVSDVKVSGKTQTEAQELLRSKIDAPEKIRLLAKERIFELSLTDVGFSYDFEETARLAFLTYRSGNTFEDLYSRLLSPFNSRHLSLKFKIDEEKLNEYLQVVSSQATTEPSYPKVSYEDGQILVDKGTPGEQPDMVELRSQIFEKLSNQDFSPTQITFTSVDPTISEKEAEELKERAEKFLDKNLSLTNEYNTLSYEENLLISLLDPRKGFSDKKTLDLIAKEIVPSVNREPQNAVFRFESGRVVEFSAAKDGLTVNTNLLKEQIIKTLETLENGEEKKASLEIPVERAKPVITTEEVNNLGIKELLGKGVSKFRGSIPGRVHNISLASLKFNGALVPPDAIFSFNETLGDVSGYTGYKQAYIIKDGRTVLGDGGGVCQVSTTFFRAILDSGLPIVERRAHSYRVIYYEQDSPVGLDATVYAPTTDLKFKNDTPAHLLIQTIFDARGSTLIFEIYGTSDGRVATTTKPVITSSTAPPEDLYVDDPTLPTGQTKQIDYKAWGAKVVFDYRVERDREVIFEKQFVSNYRPWQAVFLRGTGTSN